MLYARPDEGLASRKLNPIDKSYEQRITEAFEDNWIVFRRGE